MDYLNDMALFVEVVKANSFRRAAEAAGVPASTLSRRISALEKRIGLKLLNRTTRRIEMTEAGATYYQRCKSIVDEARVAHEELGDLVAHPSGTLRVSLPVDFATVYLSPLLPEFAELYPGIDFELDLTPRRVDLMTEPFDLAIRVGQPENPNLIARVIARTTARLYAAPDYLARRGAPAHPADLAHHECLSLRKGVRWSMLRDTETHEFEPSGRFHVNSISMMRRLAVQGLGITFLPERILRDDLHSGALVPVLPGWQSPATPIYAVTSTRLVPARTQRFIDFLTRALRDS